MFRTIQLFVIIILIPLSGLTQTKLKNGFKDVELGKHISSFQDFTFQRKTYDGFAIYKKKNQDLSIGNIKLKAVDYYFYDNILTEIRVGFDSFKFRELVDLFSDTYGQPTKISSTYYSWSDSLVGLSIKDLGMMMYEGKVLDSHFIIRDIQASISRDRDKKNSQAKDL